MTTPSRTLAEIIADMRAASERYARLLPGSAAPGSIERWADDLAVIAKNLTAAADEAAAALASPAAPQVGKLIVDVRYGYREHHAVIEAGMHPRWFDQVVETLINLGAAPAAPPSAGAEEVLMEVAKLPGAWRGTAYGLRRDMATESEELQKRADLIGQWLEGCAENLTEALSVGVAATRPQEPST